MVSVFGERLGSFCDFRMEVWTAKPTTTSIARLLLVIVPPRNDERIKAPQICKRCMRKDDVTKKYEDYA